MSKTKFVPNLSENSYSEKDERVGNGPNWTNEVCIDSPGYAECEYAKIFEATILV